MRTVRSGREVFDDESLWSVLGVELTFLRDVDLVLVFDDVDRIIDEYVFVALKVDYMDKKSGFDGKLSSALKSFEQLVKLYELGFDAVVLWHYFDWEVKDDVVRSFCSKVGEAVEKLPLPVIYFATKALDSRVFKMFKPFEVESRSDVASIAQWMSNIVRDYGRNPLIAAGGDVVQHRLQLREALGLA
ncbi:MAG: hypothetical protein DRJ20_01910 [Candidatus Methanomethylicota archaeon]|uniref:Uncharacterized protein n=1 Tax=Thermoproteota archaeon TaxID=2056631 RepID=A0A497EWM5_9CREN|nr:MAG: hypothetical protein DRJ20_01910 [Candidatus Verstraetearchaeota archaeon]